MGILLPVSRLYDSLVFVFLRLLPGTMLLQRLRRKKIVCDQLINTEADLCWQEFLTSLRGQENKNPCDPGFKLCEADR